MFYGRFKLVRGVDEHIFGVFEGISGVEFFLLKNGRFVVRWG